MCHNNAKEEYKIALTSGMIFRIGWYGWNPNVAEKCEPLGLKL
jgi:hypothetical protein